jgi:hypothetical protein
LILATGAALVGAAACASGPGQGEPSGQPSGGAPGSGTAATVSGQTITLDEVDDKARSENIRPYQALYSARRATLEAMIGDRLLEKEAASRGISKEELVDQEITQKAEPVTDESVRVFFEQNKARMGGRPLEQIEPQIRNFLGNQSQGQARNSYLGELKSKADVRILLDAPRVPVQVAANDPVKGPDGAPVTIIEFGDFQ